jgi:hypothetical protein
VPASRAKRVAPRAQIVGHSADTKESAERLLDTLVVGSNRIVHNLGRKPIGATITPTVADASFAWALGSSDDRIAIITIVGVAQPKATIEFY